VANAYFSVGNWQGRRLIRGGPTRVCRRRGFHPPLRSGYSPAPDASRSASKMRDYHINIFYSEDDDGYIADIPDLEACSAFGETPDEALREVQQAKKLWLEAARAEGKPVPAPEYRPVIYQVASA
jgi:predicted RNase H-like HicB family nuclease